MGVGSGGQGEQLLTGGGRKNIYCPRAPGTLATPLWSHLEIFLLMQLHSLSVLLDVGCGLVSQNLKRF